MCISALFHAQKPDSELILNICLLFFKNPENPSKNKRNNYYRKLNFYFYFWLSEEKGIDILLYLHKQLWESVLLTKIFLSLTLGLPLQIVKILLFLFHLLYLPNIFMMTWQDTILNAKTLPFKTKNPQSPCHLPDPYLAMAVSIHWHPRNIGGSLLPNTAAIIIAGPKISSQHMLYLGSREEILKSTFLVSADHLNKAVVHLFILCIPHSLVKYWWMLICLCFCICA